MWFPLWWAVALCGAREFDGGFGAEKYVAFRHQCDRVKQWSEAEEARSDLINLVYVQS